MTVEMLNKGNKLIGEINKLKHLVDNYSNLSIRFYDKTELIELPAELKSKIDVEVLPMMLEFLQMLMNEFEELGNETNDEVKEELEESTEEEN